MNDADFVRLVAEMRSAQRNYFRRRTPAALEESRRLEGRVDDAIRERMRQPRLFQD